MKKQNRSRLVGVVEPLESRALMTMTPTAQLPNVDVTLGGIPTAVDLDSYFKNAHTANDIALINTNLGTIPVALTASTTPTTVANFLSHVQKGTYTGTLVDRSVPGSSWAAGAYQLNASSVITPTASSSPIKSEAGAASVRGTIATVPVGQGSDATRFVFNETNNKANGSTVFGHVLGAQGLAVMDAISAIPVPSSSPLQAPLTQAPLQYYTAGQPIQAYNLTTINNITTASEYYTATSDNPGVATVAVDGSNLNVQPESVGTAHVTITGYGSDGASASETFAVSVDGRSPAVSGAAAGTTLGTPEPATTTATAPVMPIAPASILIPSAQGTLPSSVVAGQKTKIAQTVTVTDPTGTLAENEQVSLSLSTTGAKADYTIASATLKVKIIKEAHAKLATNRLSAAIPAGSYHLLVSVTDPDGGVTTNDTGETLTVLAPSAKQRSK